MKNIEDRMIDYAQQDEYHVTQNLLIEGANEIARLRKEIQRRIPPCSAHAFQSESDSPICCGNCDNCNGTECLN